MNKIVTVNRDNIRDIMNVITPYVWLYAQRWIFFIKLKVYIISAKYRNFLGFTYPPIFLSYLSAKWLLPIFPRKLWPIKARMPFFLLVLSSLREAILSLGRWWAEGWWECQSSEWLASTWIENMAKLEIFYISGYGNSEILEVVIGPSESLSNLRQLQCIASLGKLVGSPWCQFSTE